MLEKLYSRRLNDFDSKAPKIFGEELTQITKYFFNVSNADNSNFTRKRITLVSNFCNEEEFFNVFKTVAHHKEFFNLLTCWFEESTNDDHFNEMVNILPVSVLEELAEIKFSGNSLKKLERIWPLFSQGTKKSSLLRNPKLKVPVDSYEEVSNMLEDASLLSLLRKGNPKFLKELSSYNLSSFFKYKLLIPSEIFIQEGTNDDRLLTLGFKDYEENITQAFKGFASLNKEELLANEEELESFLFNFKYFDSDFYETLNEETNFVLNEFFSEDKFVSFKDEILNRKGFSYLGKINVSFKTLQKAYDGNYELEDGYKFVSSREQLHRNILMLLLNSNVHFSFKDNETFWVESFSDQDLKIPDIYKRLERFTHDDQIEIFKLLIEVRTGYGLGNLLKKFNTYAYDYKLFHILLNLNVFEFSMQVKIIKSLLETSSDVTPICEDFPEDVILAVLKTLTLESISFIIESSSVGAKVFKILQSHAKDDSFWEMFDSLISSFDKKTTLENFLETIETL